MGSIVFTRIECVLPACERSQYRRDSVLHLPACTSGTRTDASAEIVSSVVNNSQRECLSSRKYSFFGNFIDQVKFGDFLGDIFGQTFEFLAVQLVGARLFRVQV